MPTTILTKKATDQLKHIKTDSIITTEIQQATQIPLMLFIEDTAHGHTERKLPMTSRAWARAEKGVGSIHHILRNPFSLATRFCFRLLVDKVDDAPFKKPTEAIVGIHCLPFERYIECNWSNELKRPIPEEAAVVQFQPDSGEMDVVAFPPSFQGQLGGFLAELEKMEEIDLMTRFTVGDVEFSIMQHNGNEIMFRCFSQRTPR